jgi:hypothetical protein
MSRTEERGMDLSATEALDHYLRDQTANRAPPHKRPTSGSPWMSTALDGASPRWSQSACGAEPFHRRQGDASDTHSVSSSIDRLSVATEILLQQDYPEPPPLAGVRLRFDRDRVPPAKSGRHGGHGGATLRGLLEDLRDSSEDSQEKGLSWERRDRRRRYGSTRPVHDMNSGTTELGHFAGELDRLLRVHEERVSRWVRGEVVIYGGWREYGPLYLTLRGYVFSPDCDAVRGEECHGWSFREWHPHLREMITIEPILLEHRWRLTSSW